MALSAKHRSTIYQSLSPILGAEEADALLSEFPMTRADELATRGDLAELRTDLRTEMADLRGELRTEMAQQGSKLAWRMLGLFTAQTAVLGLLVALSA